MQSSSQTCLMDDCCYQATVNTMQLRKLDILVATTYIQAFWDTESETFEQQQHKSSTLNHMEIYLF